MTTERESNEWSYAGNGVATSFAVDERIQAATDLSVRLVYEDTGLATNLVLNTNYTVTGINDDQGATVVMTIPPATGYTLKIFLEPQMLQTADFRSVGGRFNAIIHEDALDRLNQQIRRLWAAVQRAVRLPTTDPTLAETASISSLLSKYLYVNSLGAVTGVTGDPSQPITHLTEIYYPLAGETVIPVSAYTPGSNDLSVFVNGVDQVSGADYTETSSTSITLAVAASLGDVIKLKIGEVFDISVARSAKSSQNITGVDGQTVLTTNRPYTPGSDEVEAYFNGSLLTPGTDFTETNPTTITLLFALNAGDQIRIIYGQVTDILTVDAQSVGEALYPQTEGEVDIAVTPSDYRYPAGNLKRYGALGDNTTSDTALIQRCFDLAASSVQGSVGTVYVPAGRYVLDDTISLSLNGSQYLNILSDLPNGGAVFEWAGAANTPMFQISGWLASTVRGITCRTRNVAGVVAWDIKTDATHAAANSLRFEKCLVEFGTGGSCIGWRSGYTAGGSSDVSGILFDSCTAYGVNRSYADIGWQALRFNNLMWTFINCQGFFLGKQYTNAKTTGAESGGGSMTFYGGGGTNNDLDFEFYTAGVYAVHGGRYEDGKRFLKTGHSTQTDQIQVTLNSLEVGGHTPTDNIIMYLDASTQLTVDTCKIDKFFVNSTWPADFCTIMNGVASREQSIIFRNCGIQAADPFYTITGSTGTVSVTVENCLKRAYLTHTPNGKFINKETFTESTYTPVWTAASVNPAIGNGTIQGTYKRKGKRITVSIYAAAGSTTTYGTGVYYFSLPVIPQSTTSTDVGQALILDSGTAYFLGAVLPLHDGTARCQVYAPGVASPTVPMTWAVNDTLNITLDYEAAP